MQNHFRQRLILVLETGMILTASTAKAQYSDAQKLAQLNSLIGGTVRTKQTPFITHYALDSLFINNQKTLSGSEVESGKLIGTSLSITDKGGTANIGLGRYR